METDDAPVPAVDRETAMWVCSGSTVSVRNAWRALACAFATGIVASCGVDSAAGKVGFALPALGEDAGLGTPERQSYEAMRRNDCDAAQSTVDSRWADMARPENVLVYQAGAELCRGDARDAKVMASAAFNGGSQAIAPLSMADGPTDEVDQQMYAAVDRSLERTFQQDLSYQTPPTGGWPDEPRADPREAVAEPDSTAPPTDTTDDTAPPTDAPSEPSDGGDTGGDTGGGGDAPEPEPENDGDEQQPEGAP